MLSDDVSYDLWTRAGPSGGPIEGPRVGTSSGTELAC